MSAHSERDRRIAEEASAALNALPASARPRRERPAYIPPTETMSEGFDCADEEAIYRQADEQCRRPAEASGAAKRQPARRRNTTYLCGPPDSRCYVYGTLIADEHDWDHEGDCIRCGLSRTVWEVEKDAPPGWTYPDRTAPVPVAAPDEEGTA